MINKHTLALRSSGKPDGDYYNDGLTMRQYYAAKAMQGIMSATDSYTDWNIAEIYAKQAFRMADAMIEYENKENQE